MKETEAYQSTSTLIGISSCNCLVGAMVSYRSKNILPTDLDKIDEMFNLNENAFYESTSTATPDINNQPQHAVSRTNIAESITKPN